MELPVDYRSLTVAEKKQVREKYIELQQGRCYHCGNKLSKPATKEVRELPIDKSLFPVGFFTYPIHLHHSHESGMTIGAVHNVCNAVLWQYHGE